MRPSRIDDVDPLDDVADEPGRHLVPVERVDGRLDRAALVVAEDDDQGHVQHLHRVLDRPEHRRVDDVTGGPDDEHVAESGVEDQFGGDPGVATAEDDGGGMLRLDEFRAVVRCPG